MGCPNTACAAQNPPPTLTLSERHGIEIDYCPHCRGVWLDRGELDKLIERAAPSASPAPAAPAAAPAWPDHKPWKGDKYHGQQPYYGKRKKSLLGEIFDF